MEAKTPRPSGTRQRPARTLRSAVHAADDGALEGDRAGQGRVDPEYRLQERGLSGAIRPDEHDDLTREYFEARLLQRIDVSVGHREAVDA